MIEFNNTEQDLPPTTDDPQDVCGGCPFTKGSNEEQIDTCRLCDLDNE